jgi:thymidylate synthase (FAD)
MTQSFVPGVSSPAELIAYTARVSNPGNQKNHTTAKKLLKSLIRDGHWSPLEMVSVTMEVVTTRDIGRQIIRHPSFRFQEFSQRYAIAEGKPVRREARLQDTKNRQNSLQTTDTHVIEGFDMVQAAVERVTQNAYTAALGMGIAKEQARAVLPEGMTSTTMYMHGTVRSWVHYCRLRMGNGTQKEHMDIAEKAWLILRSHFRDICDAVEELEDDKTYSQKIIELLKEEGHYLELLERVKNNS